MQFRKTLKAFSLLCFLNLGIQILNTQAQSIADLYQTVEASVVKVRCPDTRSTATGFVWNNRNNIVTSLHVVDGSSNIQVYYPQQKIIRNASVSKVLKRADLVLLSVDNAPNIPVLPHSGVIPSIDEEVHSLGFAFNYPAINSLSFKLRYGGRLLKDNISDKVYTNLVSNGYPDPNQNVLKLGQESLLPGMSGSPIFDSEGKVVGIGNGGLEEGAINISWGIPASNLNSLLASTSSTLPNSPGTKNLYAAELKLDIGETITSGDVSLIKTKTRSLFELASTADDALGLNQLSAVFGNIDKSSFQYDIYQEVNSGATFVLPYGVEIQPISNNFWKVEFPNSTFNLNSLTRQRLGMLLQIKPTNNLIDGQNQSVNFENKIIQTYSPVVWQQDNAWSYLVPFTRFDGVTVRRKAANGVILSNNMWISDKYMFETLALKNNMFMGLSVIDQNLTPQNFQKEMLCNQGIVQPDCSSLYEFRKIWAQIVLGIQLTSFSL